MKKNYTKPSMEIERFDLSQQITACSGIQVHYTDSECVKKAAMYVPNSMVDLATVGFFMAGCKLEAALPNEHDGICFITAFNPAFTS